MTVQKLERGRNLLNQDQRFYSGFTATLVAEDGELTSLVIRGKRREGMRALAAHCDANGLKVVAVSTPESIWRDLQGTRSARGNQKSTVRKHEGHTEPPETRVLRPEITMLAAVGRSDLLA